MLDRYLRLVDMCTVRVQEGRFQEGFGEKDGVSELIFTPGKRGMRLGFKKTRKVSASADRSMTSNQNGVDHK